MDDSLSVVVLAYGPEPHLEACISSILANEVVTEILIVDNGATDAIDRVPDHPAIRIVSPGHNTGFAGGCNLAAAAATGDTLVFVNSDAELAPDACAVLQARLEDTSVGMVTASIRFAEHPEAINSVGNPVQFLMFSWAGSFGSAAAEHEEGGPVASVSGATFAIRRELWLALDGFSPSYFAYGEDLELSMRTWLAGYQVIYEPRAIARHWYEFSRTPTKLYLLERNRLMTMLTIYEKATLLRLLPIALFVEFGVLVTAIRNRWARQKMAGWWWIVQNRAQVSARRRFVQAARTQSDSLLAELLQAQIDPPPDMGFAVPPALNRLLSRQWGYVASSIRKRAIGGRLRSQQS